MTARPHAGGGREREAGFTLIELLIAIAVIGVVISALAASIVAGINRTTEVQDVLAGSHDAEMLSTYLVSDVASTESFTASCGTAEAGSSEVLALAWTDPRQLVSTTDDVDRTVVYRTDATGQELLRYSCDDGVEATGSPATVAHLLASGASSVTVSCVDGAGAVTAAPCDDAATRTVRLSASLCVRDGAGACKPEPASLTVELTGTRRIES